MPRRVILSAAERASLVALADDEDDLNNCYEFSEHELSVIRRHRGAPNRLGSPCSFAPCVTPASC